MRILSYSDLTESDSKTDSYICTELFNLEGVFILIIPMNYPNNPMRTDRALVFVQPAYSPLLFHVALVGFLNTVLSYKCRS